jgi:hypothetical protein
MQESSVQSQDIKAANTVVVPAHSQHSLTFLSTRGDG